MIKSLKNKKGNEILQVIIVIAILGTLTVSVCWAINTKFKSASKTQLNSVDNSLTDGVTAAKANLF